MRHALVALFLISTATPGYAHDGAFFIALAKHDTTTPAEAPALARELAGMLDSPDPALRDDVAYTLFVGWIYQRHLLPTADLVALSDSLLASLRSNEVLRRSYSALILSVIVARDNDAPSLSSAQLRRIFDGALAYLASEHDLRGYDDKLGWIHTTAHTADLLKFLVRSPALGPADYAAVLLAITHKLDDASVVFTFGEDERLARVVFAIVNRPSFDLAAFTTWLASMTPQQGAISGDKLRRDQNRKNLLAKLDVLVNSIAKPTPAQLTARTALRGVLAGLF